MIMLRNTVQSNIPAHLLLVRMKKSSACLTIMLAMSEKKFAVNRGEKEEKN